MNKNSLPNSTPTRKRLTWNLRMVMANRGIWTATELHRRLADFGIEMSSAHLSRFIQERPNRINAELLEALISVLDCDISELLVVEEIHDPSTPPVAGVGTRQAKGSGKVAKLSEAKVPGQGARTKKALDDATIQKMIGPKVTALPIPERKG